MDSEIKFSKIRWRILTKLKDISSGMALGWAVIPIPYDSKVEIGSQRIPAIFKKRKG